MNIPKIFLISVCGFLSLTEFVFCNYKIFPIAKFATVNSKLVTLQRESQLFLPRTAEKTDNVVRSTSTKLGMGLVMIEKTYILNFEL